MQIKTSTWLWRVSILLVAALAFALRIEYLTSFSFHIDEFYTLTAANFVAESGQPIYPTGYFYDPGLPYTYLAGFVFKMLGFSEAMGRWPSVIFGVLAVVTVYWLGTRILRAQSVGLLAALLLAVSVDSVEWSARVRATTLAQWLVLLSVALLWLGLTRASTRSRLLFAFSYGLALLSHFATVVLFPAWFVAGAGLWWMKAVKFNKALVRDGIIFLLAVALALSSGVIFQPPPSLEFQSSGAGLDTKTGELGDKFLQIPSDLAHAWKAYGGYFVEMPHLPITILLLVGLVIALWRLVRGKRGKRDVGGLYLGLIFLTVLTVLALVIAPHWQRNRYLVMQGAGIFFLLGAHGLREIVILLTDAFKLKPILQSILVLIFGAVLLFPFLAPLQQSMDIGETGWRRYDLALGHVRDNLAEGDRIMTMNPPPVWLYLQQNDYYFVESSPKLLLRPDGSPGDRYTGATWISTVEEFDQLLEQPERLWLVAEEFWIFNSYAPYLQQEILQRMDKQWGEGGVWALSSRPGTWPLAKEMVFPVNGEFETGVRLVGFTANPPSLQPGGAVQLTLFWSGETMPFRRKVFVQVRNASNETVAQADHFIYDDKVPLSRWGALLESGGVVRDGTTLFLPPDLQPGTYRVLVGFYYPENFERLGVVNDQSGESAVILGEFVVE